MIVPQECPRVYSYNCEQMLNRQGKQGQETDLQAPWRTNPRTRQQLIQRINQSSRDQALPFPKKRTLNDEAIAEEYYRMWLEMPILAAPQRIAQHPLMTHAHRLTINKTLEEQKTSQLKWTFGGTCFTLFLYTTFMSRMALFRNFFNNSNSYRVTRGIKKTLGVYILFLSWFASLSSSYQKSLPDALDKEGLLKELDYLHIKKQ